MILSPRSGKTAVKDLAVNFMDQGGIGYDPVFRVKAELYDNGLAQYPEYWWVAAMSFIPVAGSGGWLAATGAAAVAAA